MPTDLDRRLAAVLRDHAGAPIDPEPLVIRARHRGRRLRRRRRAALGTSLAAVALLALAVIPGMTRPAGTLQPPAAPDRPGAQQRPDLVGTDPGTLHFTADGVLPGADRATWAAGRGVETVALRSPDGQARFALTRSAAALDALPQTLASAGTPTPPAATDLGGTPATAWSDPAPGGGPPVQFLRWQPTPGLWAQLDISAPATTDALAAAARLRFDGARRCAVPFSLTSLPKAASVQQCSITLQTGASPPFTEAAVIVGDPAGRWLTVRAQPAPGSPDGPLEAGPHRVRRQGSDVLQAHIAPCQVELFLDGWGEGFTEPEALTVLSGYVPAPYPDDPTTW